MNTYEDFKELCPEYHDKIKKIKCMSPYQLGTTGLSAKKYSPTSPYNP